MSTEPAYRATAAEIAVDLITAIHNGHYQPGDKLPSQTELMTTYGVAMATAAAALRKLRDHGLTTTQPGRGVYLTTALLHTASPRTATTAEELGTRAHDEGSHPDSSESNGSQRWKQRYTDIATLYHAADRLTALAEQAETLTATTDDGSPLGGLHPTVLKTLAHTLTTAAHHIINHGPTSATHTTITAAHRILTQDGRR
ncbi:GntR family transcriptional regulator [Nocardia sp. NPDC088792]|uniref:GntR family transcriptional regulator n=1 Tax=Nocardia sp. NPDC088792 TaxID=3364332 RepID=UPI003809F3E4